MLSILKILLHKEQSYILLLYSNGLDQVLLYVHINQSPLCIINDSFNFVDICRKLCKKQKIKIPKNRKCISKCIFEFV